MYNDYSIHNCTIPTTSFKLQGVSQGTKLITVVLDLGGLRMKNVSLVLIVNFGNQLISHSFSHLPPAATRQQFLC